MTDVLTDTKNALIAKDEAILKAMKTWSRILVAVTILNAILVLVGWQFHIEFLKRPFPTLVAMNPVTGVGFFFIGCSFLLLDSKSRYWGARAVGFVLIGIPILIGTLRILGEGHVINFQIDLIVFRDRIEADGTGYGPGRMASSSAVCFLLLSIAVINLHLGSGINKALSNYLAMVVFLFGLFKCIGYLYRVEELFNLLRYDPMSVRTAICLVLFSMAVILYNPTKSYFSVIASAGTSGVIVRLFIPLAILIPVVFGYIRLLVQWRQPIKVELGVAVLITTIVITFLILILFASHVIHKKEILQRAAETRFQALLESAPDSMVIVDAAGIIQIANAQTEKLFGFKKDELLGQKVELLIPKRFHVAHPHHRTDFFKSPKARSMGVGLELCGLKKNGEEFPVEISLSPLQTEKGVLVSAAIRDITERTRVDEKMRFLATIAESIQDPVITSNNNSVITRWNPAAEKLLEWTSEEAIGMIVQNILRPTYLEQSLEQILAVLAENGFWHGEVIYHTKSGATVNVIATASRLKDAQDQITGNIILVRNITRRKRAEEKLSKLNAELETRVRGRTNELEKAYQSITELNAGLEDRIASRTMELELANKELEAFSYSVAHDLRTPLRAVAGYSTMLTEDYHDKLDDEGKRLLAELQFNNKKMGNLIDDLLTFSRLGRKPVNKSLVDMKQLVTAVLSDLSLQGSKIVAQMLYPVFADASLMRNVMTNLISNAVKYSSKNENAKVEIFSERKERTIVYSVRDNGVGFDMAYAEKLFGVFQRLHSDDEFHGTGVGLAIVQRIITRHGGAVWAQAKVNEGATFSFSLPDMDEELMLPDVKPIIHGAN